MVDVLRAAHRLPLLVIARTRFYFRLVFSDYRTDGRLVFHLLANNVINGLRT